MVYEKRRKGWAWHGRHDKSRANEEGGRAAGLSFLYFDGVRAHWGLVVSFGIFPLPVSVEQAGGKRGRYRDLSCLHVPCRVSCGKKGGIQKVFVGILYGGGLLSEPGGHFAHGGDGNGRQQFYAVFFSVCAWRNSWRNGELTDKIFCATIA